MECEQKRVVILFVYFVRTTPCLISCLHNNSIFCAILCTLLLHVGFVHHIVGVIV